MFTEKKSCLKMKQLYFKVLILLLFIISSCLNIACSYNNVREDIIRYDQQYQTIPEWDELNNLQQTVSDNLSLNTYDIYGLEKSLINLVETRDKIIEKLNIMQVPDILKTFHENKLNQLIYRNQADTLLLEDFRYNLLTNNYDNEKSKKVLEEIKEIRNKSENYFLQADKLRKEIYNKYDLNEMQLKY